MENQKNIALPDLDQLPEAFIEKPIDLFLSWFEVAQKTEPNDPNAMALATISADGWPSVRMVLFKSVDEKSWTFFTNRNSQKGRELSQMGRAALCIHWKTLGRQVRVTGLVKEISSERSDLYFHSRPRGSQIAAWASDQSHTYHSPKDLEERVRISEEKFVNEAVIPRPPHWVGFDLVANRIEFWQSCQYRLHKRLVFSRDQQKSWQRFWLYP